jgi:hypothetical protein
MFGSPVSLPMPPLPRSWPRPERCDVSRSAQFRSWRLVLVVTQALNRRQGNAKGRPGTFAHVGRSLPNALSLSLKPAANMA